MPSSQGVVDAVALTTVNCYRGQGSCGAHDWIWNWHHNEQIWDIDTVQASWLLCSHSHRNLLSVQKCGRHSKICHDKMVCCREPCWSTQLHTHYTLTKNMLVNIGTEPLQIMWSHPAFPTLKEFSWSFYVCIIVSIIWYSIIESNIELKVWLPVWLFSLNYLISWYALYSLLSHLYGNQWPISEQRTRQIWSTSKFHGLISIAKKLSGSDSYQNWDCHKSSFSCGYCTHEEVPALYQPTTSIMDSHPWAQMKL